MDQTMVMPVMPMAEAPVMPEKPEPMDATMLLRVEPPPAPMDKMDQTMVMPVMPMADAPVMPEKPEPMDATTIMHVSDEEPSAYLTRQGQSPWRPTFEPLDTSPASTQLMPNSLLSRAMEATGSNTDSALAPVPPEVSAMEGDSPLAKVGGIPASLHPMSPSIPVPDRNAGASIGMAVTPSTVLMPVQPALEKTVPIKRSSAIAASPSVPGYPDRQIPAPPPEPKVQTKPIERTERPERQASPIRPVSPTYLPMTPHVPTESSSKIWIPVAIGILLLVIGGIYFAFFKTSLKTISPIVASPNQTAEPSLPVPPKMQADLAKARAGDAKAMHMLGVSFFYGLDVQQNKTEGLRWMRKAALAGNEKAKSDLRQMESGVR
jgi:hypothetical protein